MNRRVILISGNGGKALGQKEVSLFAKKISKLKGTDLTLIGNGNQSLSIHNVMNSLEKINKEQEITIIMQSHGLIKEGFHFNLGNYSTVSSKKLFKEIRNILGNKPIDIFTPACHGEGMLLDKEELPVGSTLVSLTSREEPNHLGDYKKMINNFHTFNGDITAYNLLEFYLLNYLKNRYKPFIAVSGQSGIHNLDSYLSNGEATNIPFDNEHFTNLGQPNRYLEVYKKLQNLRSQWDIRAADYGIAMSICLNDLKNKCLVKK